MHRAADSRILNLRSAAGVLSSTISNRASARRLPHGEFKLKADVISQIALSHYELERSDLTKFAKAKLFN